MVTINKTSKRGKKFINAYQKSTNTDLYECYKSYSMVKLSAMAWCKREFNKENGQEMRILSFNTFQFTVGWLTPDGDLRVETAYNSYIIQ